MQYSSETLDMVRSAVGVVGMVSDTGAVMLALEGWKFAKVDVCEVEKIVEKLQEEYIKNIDINFKIENGQ